MEPEQEEGEYPVWNWKWPDEGIGVDGFNEEIDDEEDEMLTGDGLNMEHHWSPSFPDLKKALGGDCDCPGLPPPPRFALPPPPVPYSAAPACKSDGDGGTNSINGALSELEYCDVQVMEGSYTQTAIPSIAVIIVCSFIILVMILVASLIFWRHKRKMQNFLPCKTSPTNHCDLNAGGSTVLYEDLTNIRPRNLTNQCSLNQTVAPMEHLEDNTLLDVKCSNYGGAGFTSVGDTAFMYPSAPNSNVLVANNHNHVAKAGGLRNKDFNSVYEEISASSDGGCEVHGVTSAVDSEPETDAEEDDVVAASSGSSEGEMAGDELSLVDYPAANRPDDFKRSVEQVVNVAGSRHCSDTSSLRGSTGDDLCRDFDDSLCSDEHGGGEHGRRSQCHRVHPQSGGIYPGPALISTEQRKRRRGKVRNNGVDLIRVPSLGSNGGGGGGKAVDISSQVPYYRTGTIGHQPMEVNGLVYNPDNGYGDKLATVASSQSPWMPRSNSSGPSGVTWRATPDSRHQPPMHYDDYDVVDDRGGMLMVIPPPPFNTTSHMQRSTSNHNQQPLMTELNVPKLSLPYNHRSSPRSNNTVYRDGSHPNDEEYFKGPRRAESESAGGGGGGVQRLSDPHERTIGEFNSFRPRRNQYGHPSQAYVLHNGPMIGGQRSSCSDGSKSSNTSVEHLLTADNTAYHPYHHHPHIANISNQQFYPNLENSNRMTLPNQARSKKKQTGEMLDLGVGRTVLT